MSEILAKPALKVGDRVTFTEVIQKGEAFLVRKREGTILDLRRFKAVVELVGTGRTTLEYLKHLTPAEEPAMAEVGGDAA